MYCTQSSFTIWNNSSFKFLVWIYFASLWALPVETFDPPIVGFYGAPRQNQSCHVNETDSVNSKQKGMTISCVHEIWYMNMKVT